METTKIKTRIGDCEFEAEGPVEVVKAQFDAFRDLINSMSRAISPKKSESPHDVTENKDNPTKFPHIPIDKIVHVAGRVVSLTALPASVEDAALLIMLGHKDLRNNLTVTGQEIGDGLAQSGRPVQRVDRVMEKAMETAHVLKTGIKRGTRYRLTNQGLTKALNIAKDLIESLP